jgi:hypothetical protein
MGQGTPFLGLRGKAGRESRHNMITAEEARGPWPSAAMPG